MPLTKNNGPISWPLRNQDRHPGFRINWFLFRKKRSSKNYQISKGQRVVESKSLKVGKSLKIGKNRIKSEKSDLISYQTFWQKQYHKNRSTRFLFFLNSQHLCRQSGDIASRSFAAKPDSVYMIYAQRNGIKILLLRNLGLNNQLSTLFHSNPLASDQTIIIIR